jgi:hypothetical protein
MKTMINLLPSSYRRQQIVHSRAYQWSVVVSLTLVLGWISHWYELSEHQATAQRLDVLSREHQPTKLMLEQLVDMRQKLVDLEHQEKIARELEYQRNALTLLGVISESAQRTNGRLRVTNLELMNFQGDSGTETAAAPPGQASGLRLEGVSLDNPAVAELIEGLQDAGIFSRVDFTLHDREGSDSSLRHYEVRCEF